MASIFDHVAAGGDPATYVETPTAALGATPDADPAPYSGASGSTTIDRAAYGLLAGAVGGVSDAVTLPRDVAAGRVAPMSDEGIARTQGMAGLMVGGGLPMAEEGAAGVAGGRLKQPAALERKLTQQAVPAYDDHQIVPVDVAKVDDLWRQDPGFYVDPSRDGPGSKLDRAADFMKGLGAGQSFKPPQLGVMDGGVGFDDGRHRFAAMRDLGLTRAPMSMDPQSVANAEAMGLIARAGGIPGSVAVLPGNALSRAVQPGAMTPDQFNALLAAGGAT